MAKFEAPIIKEWDFDSLNFEKNKKISMEKVVGEKDLALQQHFSYKSSKFSENSNCRVNLLLNVRGLKLDHFAIFDALFLFLTFFKL